MSRSSRPFLALVLLALTACGGDDRTACERARRAARAPWEALAQRIDASLEADVWCFHDPRPLRDALASVIAELVRLRDAGVSTEVKDLDDPGFRRALDALKTLVDADAAQAESMQCPPTPMVTAFQSAHGVVEGASGRTGTGLTLLDEQRNPVELPWTPRVLLLSIEQVPERIDAELRSQEQQRTRSSRLREQIGIVLTALDADGRGAPAAAEAVDESLVPVLLEPLREAKRATAEVGRRCGS